MARHGPTLRLGKLSHSKSSTVEYLPHRHLLATEQAVDRRAHESVLISGRRNPMRRTIEITVPPASTNTVLEELEQLEHVIGLSVERGASVKPPGDVVTVHTLNRGADDVLKIADGARRHGSVSVVTAELASIIDPEHEHKVSTDVDEGIW